MSGNSPNSIAFVALGGPDSTMSLRAREFATHLSPLGWHTTVVFPDRCIGEWQDLARQHGFVQPSFRIEFARQKPHLIVRDLADIVRRNKVNWLHFLNPELKALLVSSSLIGVRYVGDWEDWHCLNRERGWRKSRLRIVDRWMRWRCEKVVTCSTWLKEKFNELGRSDVAYIPYAELPREIPFKPCPYEKPTAVYMGSLRSYWDHRIVIDAAKVLADRGQRPNIEIIGSGEDLESCREYCHQQG